MASDVDMGPVITLDSKERIEKLIETGVEEGAELLLDGRNVKVTGFEDGYFIGPTILGNVDPESQVYKTEIFGPVLSIINVNTLEEAIALINKNRYGNSACIFTRSGAAARKFRHDTLAGNIGVNIGVAAPMAFFRSADGRKFFGDLHGQTFHAGRILYPDKSRSSKGGMKSGQENSDSIISKSYLYLFHNDKNSKCRPMFLGSSRI